MKNLDQERSEKTLLVLLIAVSAFMIIRAQRWGFETSVFPEFTAGATLIGSVLLLGRKYLPEPLQTFVASSVRVFDQSEEEVEEVVDTGRAKDRKTTDRPLSPTQFTAALITVYITLGTLFGVWWVTPLFIIAYGLWFRVPWYITGTLIVFSVVLIYIFKVIFIVPIDQGLLLEPLLEVVS